MIIAPESSPIGLIDLECDDCNTSDYCQPWPNGRRQDIQLQFEQTGYDLLEGAALDPLYEGQTTTVGTSQIIDSGASFALPPAIVGMLAANVDTGLSTTITGVAGATAINLDSDIFGTGTLGDTYIVSKVVGLVGSYVYQTDGVAYSIQVSPNLNGCALVIFDAFPNTTNRFWVEIDFEDYVEGNPYASSGNYPGTLTQLDEAAPSVNSNGTFKFIGIPTGSDLVIFDSDPLCNYRVTGVRIYYVERPEIVVYDSTSTEEDRIDPVLYLHDRANFQLPWDYGNGCYSVFSNNFNGLVGLSNFPNELGWTFEGGWEISTNRLVHVAGVGAGTEDAVYELGFTTDPNCNYVIYLDIVEPDDPPLELPTIYLVTADGDVEVSTYIDSSGNNYINIYGYEFTAIKFTIAVDEGVAIEAFNIYNTYYNQAGGYFSPDETTELTEFRLAPYFCTQYATVCVQDTICDYLKFESSIQNTDFVDRLINNRYVAAESTWTETMFLKASVRNGRYEGDNFQGYRNINGRGKVVFSQRRKLKEVQIAAVPEWVHDWITWAYLNVFEIEDIEYVPIDGSYSPNWSRLSAEAPAVFDVYKQDQKTIKTGC